MQKLQCISDILSVKIVNNKCLIFIIHTLCVFVLFCCTHNFSCAIGWGGGVAGWWGSGVAHEILVKAQGPLSLGLGLKGLWPGLVLTSLGIDFTCTGFN